MLLYEELATPERDMFKKILIPTDGSQISDKAAKAGVALARALGAKVVAYYAVEPLPTMYLTNPNFDAETYRLAEKSAQQVGQKYVDKIGKIAKASGVPFISVATKALSPSEGIIEVAKKQKCDVIIIASHGRSGFSKLLVGSVTQKIVALAHIPVIVYR